MRSVQTLILDVFDPKSGENIIILNDFPSSEKEVDADYIERKEMANKWHQTFKELAKKLKITVEPIITYEPTLAHGTPLPQSATQGGKKINLDDKLRLLGKKDIVIAITRFSGTGPLTGRAIKQKFRVASMPGALMDMAAFDADYRLVAKKAHILAKKLTEATAAVVTFSTGHEIYIDLRDRTAEVDDGQCAEPGQSTNLPAGEAYIAPFDAKGSKTVGFIPVYYDHHLVVYEVKENKIIDVITDSPKSRQMQKYYEEDPARANIAEFGLGCNDKATFIHNVIQDEKIEGMHWAYGYNDYMGGTVGIKDFKNPLSAIHVDVVYTKEAKIKVKQVQLLYKTKPREVIMENSRYSFNIQKEFQKA